MAGESAPEPAATPAGEQTTSGTASGSAAQTGSIGILPADHWAQISQVGAATNHGSSDRWCVIALTDTRL